MMPRTAGLGEHPGTLQLQSSGLPPGSLGSLGYQCLSMIIDGSPASTGDPKVLLGSRILGVPKPSTWYRKAH